jgi:hypothetical protein
MRLVHLAGVLGCLPVALLAVPSAADANWSSPGSGTSYAQALSLGTPTTPTLVRVGGGIKVTWTAVTIGGATTTYTVHRYDASNVEHTITASCTGNVSGVTCTETTVATGSWHYKVQAHKGSWDGSLSAASAAIA